MNHELGLETILPYRASVKKQFPISYSRRAMVLRCFNHGGFVGRSSLRIFGDNGVEAGNISFFG